MKKLISPILLLTSLAALAVPQQELSNAFYIAGKPIRPSCIAVFNLGATANPFVTGLDLTECQKSVTTNRATYQDANGQIRFYLNNKDDSEGSYSYQVLGKTTAGIYVLHTFESKKGGEINDMLLLLRLEKGAIPLFARGKQKQEKSALIANLAGFVKGGDRCSGGIKSVSIDNYNINVEQYSYMNSVQQCKGETRYTIDTSIWGKTSKLKKQGE